MPHALFGIVVALVLVASPVAFAQLTTNELKCQLKTHKSLSKVAAAKAKCILQCESKARKAQNLFTDCDPPYAGETLTCITDSVKGAEAKAIAKIVASCKKDCPECFSGCTAGGEPSERVAYASAAIDAFTNHVGCEETTNKPTVTCIDGNAKVLAAYVGRRDKCYQRCAALVFKGQATMAACTPPATHPGAAACLNAAETKATAAINKFCFTPPAVAPACYDGIARPNTAAGWATIGGAAVDGDHDEVFCGN